MATIRPAITGSCLAATLILTACDNAQTETLNQDQGTGARAVATVNGTPITSQELSFFLQRQSQGKDQDVSRDDALNDLINLELLSQQAEKSGIADREDVKATLTLQRNNLLANTLLQEQIKKAEFTEQDLKREYEKQLKTLGGKEYKARHILLKEEKEAATIIEQLDQGADFVELAKENSIGPSGPNGGDLGWFQSSSMVKPFADAIKGMTPGTHSKQPTQTQFGWHVILLEEVRDVKPPSFETQKVKLRSTLVNKWLMDYLAELRNKADIQTH